MIRRLSLLLLLTLLTSAAYAAAPPAPVILNISPNSAIVGTGSFTMTVNGANFLSGANVRVNGSNRSTVFVSASKLTATILGTDVLSPGTLQITVANPGLVISGSVAFQVLPNAPQITSIDPSTVQAGSAGFSLHVVGQNFGSTTVVNVNGSSRTTTFVDSNNLNAQILASDVASVHTVNITVTNPSNKLSNSVPLTITNTAPGPTITVLNPNQVNAGGPAFTLQVVGSNFVSGAVVRANGANRPTTFVDASHLNAQITTSDISSPGTVSITVTNPGAGSTTSDPATLTVQPSNFPIIQTLSPDHVQEKSGGFTMTVTGTGFTAGATVRVNGSNRSTTFISATRLTATILSTDVATSGQRSITVASPGGGPESAAATLFITALNGPVTTSVSPASVAVGSPSTKVIINGSNFLIDDIALANGSARTTEFVSSTQIAITLTTADLATAGTIQITVQRKDGSATSAPVNLTVSDASSPAITSLDPSTVNVGSSSFVLAVTGTNFQNGAVVLVNSSPRSTTFVDVNHLAASITAADVSTVGLVPISVTNPGGQTSAIVNLNVVLPVPDITSLTPNSVISGDVGFQLTVSGTNFTSHSVIKINGVAKPTTLQSSTGALTTQIDATDIAAPTTLSVTVTDNGATSSPALLDVLRPTITSVDPPSLSVGATATTITVKGTSFLTTSKIVFKGLIKETVFNAADGSLSATLGGADLSDSGSFGVTVKNSDLSMSQPFIVQVVSPGDPTIFSITPAGLPAGSGAQTLTIAGANFVATSVVKVNGTPRTTTFVGQGLVTAALTVADTANPAVLNVTVANPDGKESPAFIVVVTGPAPPRHRSVRH